MPRIAIGMIQMHLLRYFLYIMYFWLVVGEILSNNAKDYFTQADLQSLEGLESVSSCCKEYVRLANFSLLLNRTVE